MREFLFDSSLVLAGPATILVLCYQLTYNPLMKIDPWYPANFLAGRKVFP